MENEADEELATRVYLKSFLTCPIPYEKHSVSKFQK